MYDNVPRQSYPPAPCSGDTGLLWWIAFGQTLAAGGTTMGCLKDKGKRKLKLGHFRCKDCGVVAKKKKRLCEPKKIKKV